MRDKGLLQARTLWHLDYAADARRHARDQLRRMGMTAKEIQEHLSATSAAVYAAVGTGSNAPSQDARLIAAAILAAGVIIKDGMQGRG